MAAEQKDYEDALSYLKTDSGGGQTVYDHLAGVILKVITERPENAVGIIEKISAEVQRNNFTPADVEGKAADQEGASSSVKAAKAASSAVIAALIAPGDEENEKPAARNEVVSSALAAATMFEAAGLSFGANKEELLYLDLAMAKLAAENTDISTLKFWGKLQGKNSDYYVVEGVVDGAELAEDEEPESNALTYFVSTHPGHALVQLPTLKPSQITVARVLKRYLTGDLEAPVYGYPPFPGTEKNLVRATIAHINADCAVSPAGYFAENDGGDGVAVNEEFAVGDVGSAEGWMTHGPEYSSLGRITPLVEIQNDEEVNLPADWVRNLLRPLAPEDWAVRTAFTNMVGSGSDMTVLRSGKWPGAFAVCQASGTWNTVYCGFGVCNSAQAFTPVMPSSLAPEYSHAALIEQEDVTEKPVVVDDEDA